GPGALAWLKLGWGRRDDGSDAPRSNGSRTLGDTVTYSRDAQYRQGLRLGAGELAWGAEWARAERDGTLATPGTRRSDIAEQHDDRSRQAWLGWRQPLTGSLLLDGQLAWQDYDKDKRYLSTLTSGAQVFTLSNLRDGYQRDRVNPRLGLAWTLSPGF